MAQPQQGSDVARSGQPKAGSTRRDGRGVGSESVAEEPRSFVAAGAEAAKHGLDRGVEAAREVARAGLKAEEELANTNRWMTQRTSEFWRASLDPLLNMQAEAIKLVEHFWRQAPHLFGFPGALAARPIAGLPFAPLFGLPAADLKESNETYTLQIELPGLAYEDLDLTIRGDTLAVSAEKRVDQAESTTISWISERRFGRFDRIFVLPRDVDRSRIAAKVQNGVLDVTLPKLAEAAETPTRIAVTA